MCAHALDQWLSPVSVELPQQIRLCAAVVPVMMLGPLRPDREASAAADLITLPFIRSLATHTITQTHKLYEATKNKKFSFPDTF